MVATVVMTGSYDEDGRSTPAMDDQAGALRHAVHGRRNSDDSFDRTEPYLVDVMHALFPVSGDDSPLLPRIAERSILQNSPSEPRSINPCSPCSVLDLQLRLRQCIAQRALLTYASSIFRHSARSLASMSSSSRSSPASMALSEGRSRLPFKDTMRSVLSREDSRPWTSMGLFLPEQLVFNSGGKSGQILKLSLKEVLFRDLLPLQPRRIRNSYDPRPIR